MLSIFLSRFGIAMSQTLIYFVNQEVFPTMFVSFSFSVCNFVTKVAVIIAPQVAEFSKPFPTIVYISLCIIAMILSVILKIETKCK